MAGYPPHGYGAPPPYGGGYGAPPMYMQPVASDPHVSPQFMNPTRVIHFRNLPFDLTLEELREFCAPWGAVVAMKDKVGSNKNQAFVEFATLESAVAIVNHYAALPEPARFRGRPTWLSFSGRDKLTNVTASYDNPTPVLQVTLASVSPELQQGLTLEALHSLFSAHGFVKKMATYARPEGGLLAWAQFPDAATATAVKNALQGQPVPPHLVNNHPSPPTLDLAFSASPDLPIRTQSPSTRDFTNAALPAGEPDMRMIEGLLPAAGGTDGPSNVLSVSFDSMTYPVTVDGVHTIFSTYGTVQKIHIFERDGRTVALVQYPDIPTADKARAALEGHAMYDGGHNVMHVVYSKHRNLQIRPGADRSRDYTGGALPADSGAPAAGPAPPAAAAAHAAGPQAPHYGPPPGAVAGPPQRPPQGLPPGGMYGAPPPVPQVDPHFHVTGEDYVRQHERVLQQHGGRTSGRGAPAPYAAAPAPPPAYGGYAPPAAPAFPPPAAPAYGTAPQAYGAYAQQPPAAGYYGAAAPAAPPAYAAPAAYAAPGGYAAAPAASYGGPPSAAGAPPAYGAAPQQAYGQPAAPPQQPGAYPAGAYPAGGYQAGYPGYGY